MQCGEEKQYMQCGEDCGAADHKKKHDVFYRSLTLSLASLRALVFESMISSRGSVEVRHSSILTLVSLSSLITSFSFLAETIDWRARDFFRVTISSLPLLDPTSDIFCLRIFFWLSIIAPCRALK